MRLTLAMPLLLAALGLSACSGSDLGVNDSNTSFPQVCAEQAEMARQGKVEGGDIRITCP